MPWMSVLLNNFECNISPEPKVFALSKWRPPVESNFPSWAPGDRGWCWCWHLLLRHAVLLISWPDLDPGINDSIYPCESKQVTCVDVKYLHVCTFSFWNFQPPLVSNVVCSQISLFVDISFFSQHRYIIKQFTFCSVPLQSSSQYGNRSPAHPSLPLPHLATPPLPSVILQQSLGVPVDTGTFSKDVFSQGAVK